MGNVYESVLDSGGVTPTPITPSDTSPVSMISGEKYEAQANGYAIESNPTTLTPNNSSPPSIANNTIYKGGGSGYAISSYTSISQSQLNAGVYFSSGFKKMASSGYAYSTEQLKKVGTFSLSQSSTTKITLGFRPHYIAITGYDGSNIPKLMTTYDDYWGNSVYCSASSSAYVSQYSLPSTQGNRIASIDSDGFTMNKASSSATVAYSWHYFAIG